jgi:pantoate--beta-alanine ligase
MLIVKTAASLSAQVLQAKKRNQSIGFAPTMGALHQGHLSLIEASKKSNDLTVCSIFVNPTQFNNKDDFQNYPITLEQDIEKLEAAGCDLLFLPTKEEVYPQDYAKKNFELGYLERILEGSFRPGHFDGVCQVVDILLTLVQPDHLYMGQKDFQQCLVVKKLLQLTHRQEQIQMHMMPTLREPDGLAMSSRNLRLSEVSREKAPAIFKTMQWVKSNVHAQSLKQLEEEARQKLSAKGFVVDYVTIANATDLSQPQSTNEPLVVLVAAFIEPVRLIDNLLLN